ncbi:MAG TPA: small metal-binding protein SmbP [Nitrospira sp.]|nr:small metal-binding protein SmbP [Nitrospira sp.]
MVLHRSIQTFVGGLSVLVLLTACSSGSKTRSATHTTGASETAAARTGAVDDRTVSNDPMDRMMPDHMATRTERPVPDDRERMPRDRVIPCADEKGNATTSLDCDQMDREGRRAGVRSEANDPFLAEACASRLDERGQFIYDDPTCPERYRKLVGTCASRMDAKGNVIYTDPNCPIRARQQMGSSYENVRWTQESAYYDRYTDKAVKHAREGEMAGEQGHIPELMRHAELALDQAKEAQRIGNQPDLNEGIRALRDSITLGHNRSAQAAIMSVRDARIKLSRAAGMNVRDTRTPEERAFLAKAVAGLRTRTVRGELTQDMDRSRRDGGEHYVLRDRNREIPIALSPDMSRQVQVGDIVEVQIDSRGQVVAISPSQ